MREKTNPFLGLVVFLLAAAALTPLDNTPYAWRDVERIVAVGDLHGDYENFVSILRGVGLVGEDLAWTGGATHLVQTGDILDRGSEARRIFDLLMRLENEAPAAGGMVHVLLGNHEEMNIAGIALDYPDYVTVDQFVSFLPGDYRSAKDKEYLAGLPPEARARAEANGLDLSYDSAYRAYWQNLLRKSNEARSAYVRGFNETYGKWLLQKNAVIVIDGIVFVHGGISVKYSEMNLGELNSTLRQELAFFQGRQRHPQSISRPFRPKIVYDAEGPLWFRGLATNSEAASRREVDRILSNLGAKAIVIGHTFTSAGGGSPIVTGISQISRFDGRIFVIDTGISHAYGGIPSALLIDKGRFSLWEPEGPAAPLKPAEVLEPKPPPLSDDVELFLRTAAVVDVRKTALAGRTEPWKVSLEKGGVVRQALFKYIDRRRPEPLPDSYRYELAAYALSKDLELGFVPPVVERPVEDIPGSLQAFVDGTITEADRQERRIELPDMKAFDNAMADLRVFVNLAYDTCRNDRDTLIRPKTGQVFRVDFAQAFDTKEGFVAGCDIVRCSRHLFLKLLAWDDKRAAVRLGPYLNKEEIRALNARRRLIIRTIRRDIRQKGEGAVLF